MKKLYLEISMTLVLLVVGVVSSLAVRPIDEVEVRFKGEAYPALTVVVEASPDFIKDTWKDFVKENYDVRLRGYGFLTNKDVLKRHNAWFKGLTEDPADMFTRVTLTADSLTSIELFMRESDDDKVGPNQNPDTYEELYADFKKYLNRSIPAYYDRQIEELKTQMSDLQDDLKEATRSVEKNLRKIEKAEEKILDNKEENIKLRSEVDKLTLKNDELQKLQEHLTDNISKISEQLSTTERTKSQVQF